jgi:hypothetical protein
VKNNQNNCRSGLIGEGCGVELMCRCKYLIFRRLSPFCTCFAPFFTLFFGWRGLIFRELRKMGGGKRHFSAEFGVRSADFGHRLHRFHRAGGGRSEKFHECIIGFSGNFAPQVCEVDAKCRGGQSGLFEFWLRFGSVTGRCGHALNEVQVFSFQFSAGGETKDMGKYLAKL